MYMGPPKLNHVDKVSVSEKFPLHKAVREENLSAVQAILQNNPSIINQQDTIGATALHLAVTCQSVEILKFLFTQGANPNLKNNQGKTPYDIACDYNKDDMKTILLDNAAYPDKQNTSNHGCFIS